MLYKGFIKISQLVKVLGLNAFTYSFIEILKELL